MFVNGFSLNYVRVDIQTIRNIRKSFGRPVKVSIHKTSRDYIFRRIGGFSRIQIVDKNNVDKGLVKSKIAAK